MDLIQPLAYFVVRALRSVMPRETKIACPHPALPPLRSSNRDSESESYESWSRHMVVFYHNPSKDITDWRVTEMRWYKNRGRLEHEYVVFTLQQWSAEPRVEFFLRFDRRSTSTVLAKEKTRAVIKQEDYEKLSVQEKITLADAVKEETELLNDRHYLIHSLKKSSSSFDHGVVADDTITQTHNADGLAKATPERAELMVAYTEFRVPFLLRDLAIITKVLTEYSDTYLLLLQQCYWMARTLVNTAIAMYKPQPAHGVPTAAFSGAGRLTAAPFLPVISRDNPEEVNGLVNTIRNAIAEDDKLVDAAHDRERKLQNEIAERDKKLAIYEQALAERDAELEQFRSGALQSLASTSSVQA